MKSSLKPSLSCSLQPSPRRGCSCLPSPWPSCAEPTRNVYSGHSLFAFRSAYSPSQVFEFKMVSFILLQNVQSHKENIYSRIYFNFFHKYWEGCSPGALMDEQPLLERLTGLHGNESSGNGIMVCVAV